LSAKDQLRRLAYERRLNDTIVAVYRALATLPGHGIAGDPTDPDTLGWRMLLSEVPYERAPSSMARWRGRVDALAARERYSDARCYAACRPSSKSAQTLFSLLEQNRVETLAARSFIGVRRNLEALAEEKWIRARPEGVVRTAGEAWLETFALLSRVPLGAPIPPSAREALTGSWRNWMSPQEAREVEALTVALEDQDAYARQALRVIAAVLGFAGEREQPTEQKGADEAPVSGEPAPGRSASNQSRTPAAVTAGDPVGSRELRNATAGMRPEAGASVQNTYRAYTAAYDQIALPGELCDLATLEQHRRELDRRLGPLLATVTRCAHRLQRRLLALQMRSWRFDLEEGLLDANRLTRVVTNPLEPVAYKDEAETRFPDTVVTLLVDNSGSMRGLPIATAAVCAEILGRVLERCGVKSEILGFTTRGWRGGRPRAQWLAAGSPEGPGRLTELRHIIFKTATEPWRRVRSRLGLMLDDGLLKENVDGEALLWAHDRLLRRPEPRRILLVISDGAPLDEATAEANDATYLERHLHQVIDRIQSQSPVELAAIGIGHDVSGYYRRAVTLRDAEELSAAIVAQLIELFDALPMSSATPNSRVAHARSARTGAKSAPVPTSHTSVHER
jgi:cobaltochelatase CobT